MKIHLNYDWLTSAILLYPIILGFIYAFNIIPFFITAPYFFLILVILLIKVLQKRTLTFDRAQSINLILLLFLIAVSVFNFSSIRYSLPILFTFYIFTLYLYLASIVKQKGHLNTNLISQFFWIYILLSVFFLLFMDFAHMVVGDRFIGFSGSPTTYAAFLAAIFVMLDSSIKRFTYLRIVVYLLVLLFVYLSKTRLILLFLVMYPLLLLILRKRRFPYTAVYLSFFVILFFLYAVYGFVVVYFPELITLRYEDARDASFGLRYHLYKIVEGDFLSGNFWEKLLGKGNEYSRLLIEREMGRDLFPHNDFLRVINDWGLFGGGVFFLFLYRISRKTFTALLISLLYLILFYSNLVFNLFLISALILASHQKTGNSQNHTEDE